ncbi:MAG: ASPIC/UnbV domain-containing protein [Kouleothrix sp.]
MQRHQPGSRAALAREHEHARARRDADRGLLPQCRRLPAQRAWASAAGLSGASARQHFGLPGGTPLRQLEIRWPDGAVSAIDLPEPGYTTHRDTARP